MCGEKIPGVSDPIVGFDQKDTTKYLSLNDRSNHLSEQFFRGNDLTLWGSFWVQPDGPL